MTPTSHSRWNVGTLRRRLKSPSGHSVPFTFWYPTLDSGPGKREGIFDLNSIDDARPAPGNYGLVAISHGSGGSDLNHHDWAEALAQAGYIVVAPKHVGDSYDFHTGIASREQLLERPRQLGMAIEAGLQDFDLGEYVDSKRIGVLGFSAGGYTSLITLGARPDFSRWARHCRMEPDARVVCPDGQAPDIPTVTDEDWEGVAVRRIRAGILLAPFAMLFPDEELARITAPLRIYRAENESITVNSANADHVASCVHPVPEVVTKPGDHYVFIAPVADDLVAKYPVYYRDAQHVNRRLIHAEVGREVVDFFNRRLGW